ncbi:hypothetical protein BRADI_1g58694v3 [Brachypodium distachyon]|uniref:Uncharacterized protein n=1 Tax=Brachypodium distachyon TaxID=15368 RepID=A0A0Q3HE95_BRADI|nr:hypothetical protein BRADI_1g58694v3 [Brachypodium distachyon]
MTTTARALLPLAPRRLRPHRRVPLRRSCLPVGRFRPTRRSPSPHGLASRAPPARPLLCSLSRAPPAPGSVAGDRPLPAPARASASAWPPTHPLSTERHLHLAWLPRSIDRRVQPRPSVFDSTTTTTLVFFFQNSYSIPGN